MKKTQLLPFTSHYDGQSINAYSSAFYRFNSPNDDRKYIKTLKQIARFNSEGMFPSRRQILLSMGEPDPSARVWFSSRSNWGTSRFAALRQAGLTDFFRKGNICYYFITKLGISFLAESRDKSTADCGGCLVNGSDKPQEKLFI